MYVCCVYAGMDVFMDVRRHVCICICIDIDIYIIYKCVCVLVSVCDVVYLRGVQINAYG